MLKHCSKCSTEKELSEFHKDANHRDGFSCWCKACVKAYQQSSRGKRAHNRANHKYTSTHGQRFAQIKHKYKMLPGQHASMYAAQNGCCGLCKEPVSYEKIMVDHDHNTGKVRGLLCRRCNFLIGYIENCADILHEAFKWVGFTLC